MSVVLLVLLVVLLAFVAVAGAGVAMLLTRARSKSLGPGHTRIDPFALGEPWRHYVSDARKAQNRFREVIERAQPGPTKERLIDIGRRIDATVDECWHTARRGDELRNARRRIETDNVERRLADATRAADADAASLDAREAAERTIQALESQLESADRMDTIIADATTRLRLLQAQLDEAVARSVELSVHTGMSGQLTDVGSDIDNVLLEMRALHEALDETEGHGGTATG